MQREIFFSFGGIAALQVVHALATNWTHLDTKLDLGELFFFGVLVPWLEGVNILFPSSKEKSYNISR